MKGNELLDTHDVAAMLGLTAQTVHRWRYEDAPSLPFFRIGGRIRYKREDVEAYIEANRETPGE